MSNEKSIQEAVRIGITDWPISNVFNSDLYNKNLWNKDYGNKEDNEVNLDFLSQDLHKEDNNPSNFFYIRLSILKGIRTDIIEIVGKGTENYFTYGLDRDIRNVRVIIFYIRRIDNSFGGIVRAVNKQVVYKVGIHLYPDIDGRVNDDHIY